MNARMERFNTLPLLLAEDGGLQHNLGLMVISL